MGKIKKILENELTGGNQSTEIYPVTSIKAVYDENNERLDNIIDRKDNEIQKELEAEVARATNAESNLRETINNITEVNENATSANIVTIDTIPNTSSSNVQQALNELFETKQEIIYDVSARNGGVVFESLSALLSSSNLNTLIPTSVRHGGMSIRFIQGSVPNSDNKYVQYRLMSDTFDTNVNNWQFFNSSNNTFRNMLITFQGSVEYLGFNDTTTASIKINSLPSLIVGYYVESGRNTYFYNENSASEVTYVIPRLYVLVIDTTDRQIKVVNAGEQNSITENHIILFRNSVGNLAYSDGYLAERFIKKAISPLKSKTSQNTADIATNKQNIFNVFCRNFRISFQGKYKITENAGGSVTIVTDSISETDLRVGYAHDNIGRSVPFYNTSRAVNTTYNVPRVNYLAIVWEINPSTGHISYGTLQVISALTNNCTPVFFAVDKVLSQYLNSFGNLTQGNDILLFNKLYAKISKNTKSINDNFYNHHSMFNGTSFYLVARQGYGYNFPNQSLYAYDNALKNGYNTLLIDVVLTGDGYFVASHDATINAQARNPDGTTIEEDFTIADHTLEEINYYDFGIRYGSQYAGMNIPLIEDFIKYCGLRNCPFILEFKVIPSDEKITEIGLMIRKYNVEKLAIIHGAESAAPKFSIACPNSPLGFSVGRFNESTINRVMSYELPNNNERWLYIGNYHNPVENTIADLDNYLDLILANNIKLGYTNTSDTATLDLLKQHGYLNVFKYFAFDNPAVFREWVKNNW